MSTENQVYWTNRYSEGSTGWDIGYASPSLLSYTLQHIPKDASILIPGCGNAWEVYELLKAGYQDITLLDISRIPLEKVEAETGNPDELHLVHQDFFDFFGQYDLILEQTFFCALDPAYRSAYAEQMHKLLKPGGRLAGLLFASLFEKPGPPFGGERDEYISLFSPYFQIRHMDICPDSIPQRAGNELWIEMIKNI